MIAIYCCSSSRPSKNARADTSMISTRFRPWTVRLARTCGDHVLRIAAVICLMCCREGSNTGLTNFAAQTMIHLSDVELLITAIAMVRAVVVPKQDICLAR